MRTVVVIGHEGMGHGDAVLGQKILGTFLRKATSLHQLSAVVFFNAGVKLLVRGGALLPELQQLHEAGVDLVACGTCVDYFDLRSEIAVGQIGGMDDILRELDRAEKTITL